MIPFAARRGRTWALKTGGGHGCAEGPTAVGSSERVVPCQEGLGSDIGVALGVWLGMKCLGQAVTVGVERKRDFPETIVVAWPLVTCLAFFS